MKKQLTLIQHMRPWGKTSGDVMLAALNIETYANSPLPFGMDPWPVDLNNVFNQIKADCDAASKYRRKGMMRCSYFRVDKLSDRVEIWHVRDEKEPVLYLTLKKTPEDEKTTLGSGGD